MASLVSQRRSAVKLARGAMQAPQLIMKGMIM
jgi:hypothetical protein